MGVVSFLLDPTFLLCLFIYLAFPFLDYIPYFRTASEVKDDVDRIAFFTDPFVFGPWLVVALVVLTTHKKKELSYGEQLCANWYLWNGPVINAGLDGFVGLLDQVPIMRRHYVKLDKRYRDHESVVSIIAIVELVFFPITCLLLYRAYWHDSAYRRPLELIVCVVQLYGTLFFTLSEYWEGSTNIVVDWKFEFTAFHIVYFWFGYLLNYVWFVVPGYLAWKSYSDIVSQFTVASTKKAN